MYIYCILHYTYENFVYTKNLQSTFWLHHWEFFELFFINESFTVGCCGLLWVVCRVVIHRQFWRLKRSIPVAVDQEDFHTTEINCNWLINEGVWIDGFPRILTPWQSKIIDWRLPSFICPTRVKAELFKAAPTDRLHWSGSWVETEIQSNKP